MASEAEGRTVTHGSEGEVHNTCVLLEASGKLQQEEAVLDLSGMEEGAVLVAVLYSEVCGTDVHLRHGRLNTVPYPIIPGHVSVGVVRHVAGHVTDVDKKQVLPGGQAEHAVPKPASFGNHLPGQFGQHKKTSGRVVYAHIPAPQHKNYSPARKTSSKSLHGRRLRGSGPVGLLAAILARCSGAMQVIVIGAPQHRLEVVSKFGIDATVDIQKLCTPAERVEAVRQLTEGRMADVVIEAAGVPAAVTEGMDLCRDGGTYVVVGQYTDNGTVSMNPHFQINRKHLTIKGCWGSDFSHFYRGVQVMAKLAGELPWELIVSREFGLSQAEAALAAVEGLQVFKALIRP